MCTCWLVQDDFYSFEWARQHCLMLQNIKKSLYYRGVIHKQKKYYKKFVQNWKILIDVKKKKLLEHAWRDVETRATEKQILEKNT